VNWFTFNTRYRDRCRPEPRALLHAGRKPREQWHGRSLREDLPSATMSGSIRFPRPEPRSRASITGWRITTLNARIPAWATAHRGSTLHHFNKPSVRSNGVNSRVPKEVRRPNVGKSGQSYTGLSRIGRTPMRKDGPNGPILSLGLCIEESRS
jgi:hypothetical protein